MFNSIAIHNTITLGPSNCFVAYVHGTYTTHGSPSTHKMYFFCYLHTALGLAKAFCSKTPASAIRIHQQWPVNELINALQSGWSLIRGNHTQWAVCSTSNNHKCEILHFALYKYKPEHSMQSLYFCLINVVFAWILDEILCNFNNNSFF